MKRPLVLATIVSTGLLAVTVFGQPPGTTFTPPPGAPPQAPVDRIDKIADNLYRIPGQGGSTAVLVHATGVLLVDTKLPDNGQAILDQVRKVTDKPVTHIINTHVHGDHTGSNAFFPAKVEIVVQENAKASMEKLPLFQAEDAKVGLPDRTYKDKMTLFSGKDAVELYYFGPAHTSGDTLVVFPSAHTMHSGDLFAGRRQPIIDTKNGGSGIAYGETIGKAAAGIKGVDKVITGHGDVMAWQDFVDYGEFNRLFAAHAKTSLAEGKSAEQALASLKLPQKLTGYLAQIRGGPADNFDVIYAELKK